MLCTHEIDAVERICDDFYIINKGSLAYTSKEDDTKKEIYKLVLNCSEKFINELKSSNNISSFSRLESIASEKNALYFSSSEQVSEWIGILSKNDSIDLIDSYLTSGLQLKSAILKYFN